MTMSQPTDEQCFGMLFQGGLCDIKVNQDEKKIIVIVDHTSEVLE